MSTMESTMLKHERIYFDSREAKAVERMMLRGSGGLILCSVFHCHPSPLEAEAEGIGLPPYERKITTQPLRWLQGYREKRVTQN